MSNINSFAAICRNESSNPFKWAYGSLTTKIVASGIDSLVQTRSLVNDLTHGIATLRGNEYSDYHSEISYAIKSKESERGSLTLDKEDDSIVVRIVSEPFTCTLTEDENRDLQRLLNEANPILNSVANTLRMVASTHNLDGACLASNIVHEMWLKLTQQCENGEKIYRSTKSVVVNDVLTYVKEVSRDFDNDLVIRKFKVDFTVALDYQQAEYCEYQALADYLSSALKSQFKMRLDRLLSPGKVAAYKSGIEAVNSFLTDDNIHACSNTVSITSPNSKDSITLSIIRNAEVEYADGSEPVIGSVLAARAFIHVNNVRPMSDAIAESWESMWESGSPATLYPFSRDRDSAIASLCRNWIRRLEARLRRDILIHDCEPEYENSRIVLVMVDRDSYVISIDIEYRNI